MLLEPAIEVIADMVCHSAIREEDLENEKAVVCDEIDMYKELWCIRFCILLSWFQFSKVFFDKL